MMLTYAFTVIIVGAWAINVVAHQTMKRSNNGTKSQSGNAQPFLRTPFDIPIVLFLVSQILSTLFSIDRHVSLWGYYSRFNGGLISSISYVLLYYVFVNNFRREQIKGLLITTLTSATLVSIYGVAEHFGIDKHLWVQDVQNRVFSTLGQPNWLAAYLAILIPVSMGLSIRHSDSETNSAKHQKSHAQFTIIWPYFVLTTLLYLTLIYTKSRSGILGTWLGIAMLGGLLFYWHRKKTNTFLRTILLLFLFLHFVYQTPFSPLNRFTLPNMLSSTITNTNSDLQTIPNNVPAQEGQQPAPQNNVLNVGVTESGDIRKIVWKGAMDIIRHYPILGSGVETFAFSYYQFRPEEHNMTSEWDFLYNKAHNEYLNYAATTGILGLGTYLLFIGSVVVWSMRHVNAEESVIPSEAKRSRGISSTQPQMNRFLRSLPLGRNDSVLFIALFAGWLSILVTNFFGFSVVIVQLFFFLIPAFLFVLTRSEPTTYNLQPTTATWRQKAAIFIIMLVTLSLLWKLGRTWYADTVFADGYHASRSGEYTQAYRSLSQAVRINQFEPFYYDELAIAASQLVLAIDPQTEATLAAEIQNQAVAASDVAIAISPNNVNFWKTRTRILYTLSQLDELYLPGTLVAIEKAKSLSPTDPKIRYNLALVYNNLEKHQDAYRELEEAVRLKPNYKEPVYAMALFYERDKQKEKAKEQLNYILTRIDPNDGEAKKMLEDLQ